MEGRVARISIAPVKALHLVNPDEVELGHAGVVGDRRFWLVDADRRLVNGKRHPELMRVRPEWDEGSRRLVLAFPDGSTVDAVVEPGESFAAELYGTPHPSRAVPGPWQEALSEFAGEPMTLLWSEGGAQDRGRDRGGWASLISRGSLERMRAEAGSAEPVDGRRFRMRSATRSSCPWATSVAVSSPHATRIPRSPTSTRSSSSPDTAERE